MDRLTDLGVQAERAGPGADRLHIERGQPWPMGAQWDGNGVNVAVFSAHASAVEWCLYDDTGNVETARIALPVRTGDVWHGRLPGAAPGLVYGLRVHGPWWPDRGHRFNAHKLLLDPWARDIVGTFDWTAPHFAADQQHPQHMDMQDNGRQALKARVVDPADGHFDWQGDRPPRTALTDTVLYELHVKGFTRLMPGVPEALRGTYAGLASQAALAHLLRLGITAVNLLPVQQLIDEHRLVRHGLRNHWGYNTIGFFCPEPRYATSATVASGQAVRDEFRRMVRALHAAGIEVILDVVYNHTAETDERGPSISFRGLDNASWYRLPPERKAGCENWTGCGNTLDMRQPHALQLVMDSLRYWVQHMHVDGFRFDLAPILGRGERDFDPRHAFFQALSQDPVLSQVKLIAEPWDIGPGGYQLGRFPRGWLEWNDRFRDTARAFWLGGDCTRGELAQRFAGSSDLYQARRRAPSASVNYVVSHDGFTLADLVAYDMRRNQANLEDNRDGHGHNLSWNCGWEGPTADPEVLALRARLKRALLATVLLAQGTPMLAAGDELGHSQHGNNNAYRQDNAIGWIDWTKADETLIAFTARLVGLRKTLLPLPDRWTTGIADAQGRYDLTWLRRTGEPLSADDWGSRMSRVLGALIGLPGGMDKGTGAPLLLLFNGSDSDADFQLPPGAWQGLFDSSHATGHSLWTHQPRDCRSGPCGAALDNPRFALRARSLVLLSGDTSTPDARP